MRWLLKDVLVIGTVFNMIFMHVEAQNAPVTRIPSVRNLNPGQLVTFPVNVNNFNNIGSVSLSCDFDNTSLTFVSAEINTALVNGGVTNVGDTDLGNGHHRLRFGWYGGGISLPDNSWIVRYTFRYLSGNTSINWFDDGASCSYTDPSGMFLNDTPSVSYYFNGNICSELPNPGLIVGPTSVNQGATNVVYSIEPLQNISEYAWSVPVGALITGGINSNSITIDFPSGASSGNISVSGIDRCGPGSASTLAVTLTNIPLAIDRDINSGQYEEKENGFRIYPNPAIDYFMLKWKKPGKGPLILRIVSTKGETLKKIVIADQNTYNEYKVDVTGMVPGIYFIHIENDLRFFFKKLVIK